MPNHKPQISVVMSVQNRPIDVLATMRSVLQQENVDLEFLIILDGASPLVEQMLRVYARDKRVRIIKQENRGLTLSLIHGCRLANYALIARVDAGDTMLPGRLEKQASVLMTKPKVGLVSSYVEVHTDEGYFLRTIEENRQTLVRGLSATRLEDFMWPVHSSTMFRKSDYEAVGGYRKQLFTSQDADLFARMSEVSELVVLPEILTSTLYSADSITGRRKDLQEKTLGLIVKAIKLRAAGESDKPILRQAAKLDPADCKTGTNQLSCQIEIAESLSERGSKHAKEYWRHALRMSPLGIRLWVGWIKSWFYRN